MPFINLKEVPWGLRTGLSLSLSHVCVSVNTFIEFHIHGTMRGWHSPMQMSKFMTTILHKTIVPSQQ